MLNFFFYLTLTLFIIVCTFLMLVILIQKGRGGGLASAFGGAGGNTAFGSKTGDVLTWATSIIFGIFIALAVVLNLLAIRTNESYAKESEAGSAPAAQTVPQIPDAELPPATPAPTAAPVPTTAPSAVPAAGPTTG
jgi:preprotein translocase subunit SecG